MKVSKSLAALALLGAAALPSAVPAASAGALPVLAGKTTVIGSRSAYARVRLTKTLTWEQTDALISGDGRAIGLVLVKEENGSIPKKPKAVDFIRFGKCFEEACPTRNSFGGAGGGGTGDRLPAGIYRLYLITDGAPARVTLYLDTLHGATTIAPRIPARAVVQTLTPRVPTTPTFYSAGDVAPFRGNGITWFSQTLEVPGNGTAAYDKCIYFDDPPAVQETAYLPTDCPGGWQNGGRPTVVEYQDPGEDYLGYTVGVYARIPAAIGAWYATTSPVDVGGVVAVWFKF